MDQQHRDRQQVNAQNLRGYTDRSLAPSWKDQCEMKQQGRREQTRCNLCPVDFPVEYVQFSAEVKRTKDEGNQAENVEVHRAWRVPPANENEQPNEKIEQAHDAQKVLGGERLFRGGRNQRRFEFVAAARKLIARLGPEAGTIEPVSDVRGAIYRRTVEA